MDINVLLGNYHLKTSIVEKIRVDNEFFIKGLSIKLSNQKFSILDFFKHNFCIIDKDNFLTNEYIRYNYFIHYSDRISINIRNQDTGNVALNLSGVLAQDLFMGPLKENLVRLGWVFPVKDRFIFEIKKVQNFDIMNELSFFSKEYLTSLSADVIKSFNTRPDSSLKLSENFIEDLQKYLIFINQFPQYDLLYKTLSQALDETLNSSDILPLLSCMGSNKKDFWKSDYSISKYEE